MGGLESYRILGGRQRRRRAKLEVPTGSHIQRQLSHPEAPLKGVCGGFRGDGRSKSDI